ncbi:MAG: hypothetical protein E7429_06980 [Ruminococcaceae bacterium]|nr:hypothetical protein [Oscillospiraceae bacterium]
MKASKKTRQYYIASLLLRLVVFVLLTVYAVRLPERFSADLAVGPTGLAHPTVLTVAWLGLMLSMLFRFFPSALESLGCQKEFAGRFVPSGTAPPSAERQSAAKGALRVLLAWLALNGLFFFAHWKGWVGDLFMVCLAAFYSVCDIICILFFCPFQSWMMHNRCCTTCRIYNWDFMMISTPLLCVSGVLATSACVVAAILLLRWELTYLRHKERFFESSNTALRCSQCQEQLCRYKRKLSGKYRT